MPTDEKWLLSLARIAAIAVVLILIFSSVVLDPLFIHPAKPVDDVVLGLLIGALMMLLGIQGIERLRGRRDD